MSPCHSKFILIKPMVGFLGSSFRVSIFQRRVMLISTNAFAGKENDVMASSFPIGFPVKSGGSGCCWETGLCHFSDGFLSDIPFIKGNVCTNNPVMNKNDDMEMGNGSVVKSIHHSYRGCELGPQHPCEVAHKPSNSSSGGMQYLLHHPAPILVHIPSTQTHAYTQLKIVKHFKRRIIRIRSLRFICFLINCVLPHKSSM